MQTIVIGHKNPDMDSICSAVAYAHLKQVTGTPNVIAARAGNTNERIDFVLHKFGVEPPVFISDLSDRVSDVMERDVICVEADSTAYDKQAKRGLVACPQCGSAKVEKSIMAPQLANTKKRGKSVVTSSVDSAPAAAPDNAPVAMLSPQESELRQKLRGYHEKMAKQIADEPLL